MVKISTALSMAALAGSASAFAPATKVWKNVTDWMIGRKNGPLIRVCRFNSFDVWNWRDGPGEVLNGKWKIYSTIGAWI